MSATPLDRASGLSASAPIMELGESRYLQPDRIAGSGLRARLSLYTTATIGEYGSQEVGRPLDNPPKAR